MSTTSNAEFLPHSPEISLPNQVSLADRFWIEPTSLGTVNDMINSARITTMALGVETHRRDTATVSEPLKDVLCDPESALFAEQQRAVDIGVLYGTILVQPDAQDAETATHALPPSFFGEITSIKGDLDLSTDNDNYLFFMRLREMEVAFSGSDVLAFCLTTTQDHMAHIFYDNHPGDSKLSKANITQLQSLYYAGVLAGALASYDQPLPKTPIQIMRGMRDPVEQVAIRMEFEPSDDLETAIEHQLSSKYEFKVGIDAKGRALVAAIPGSLQYGPNVLSVPILIPDVVEPAQTSIFQEKDIDALLMAKSVKPGDADESTSTTLRVTKSVSDTLHDMPDDEKVVGIISKDFCISAYDIAHPWALAIDKLIRQEMNIEEGAVKYCNEIQLWEELHVQQPVKRIARIGYAAALLSIWIPDVAGKITIPDYEVQWAPSLTITGAVLALGGALRWAKNKHQRMITDTDTKFDHLYQNYLDDLTLHNTKNSGNIAS